MSRARSSPAGNDFFGVYSDRETALAATHIGQDTLRASGE
jgi:hypothetical protein